MTEHETRHTHEGYGQCATCNQMFWGSDHQPGVPMAIRDRMTLSNLSEELLSESIKQMSKLGDAVQDVLDAWDDGRHSPSPHDREELLIASIEALRTVLGPNYKRRGLND